MQPMVVVLTNVDRDHLANYEGSFTKLKEAFVAFIHNLPFYGLVVACIDDPTVRMMLPALTRPVVTYGFSEDADYRVLDWQQRGKESQFKVIRPHAQPFDIELSMPGKHNVLNAVAALAVASDEGVSDEAIIQGLAQFAGVGRRFEVHGECSIEGAGFFLVDDYGHHPVEIAAALDASRLACVEGKVIAIMQPHRFTRLRDLFDDFCNCFQDADIVFITDVYAAGEPFINGCNSESLVEGINKSGQCQAFHLEDPVTLASRIAEIATPGDFIIFLGAGNITTLAQALPKELEHIFGVNQLEPITTGNSNKRKILTDLNSSQEIEEADTIQ